jgi:enoyl-CoA hydratase/carnithine racemase
MGYYLKKKDNGEMIMNQWETIELIEREEYPFIKIIRLNRPDVLNALNTKMGEELLDCLKQLEKGDQTRTLIFTGAGEKAFCPGADLKERNGMSLADWKKQHDLFEEAYAHIRNFPYPTIAAVNGYAMGGGMEMALSCDIRIASENASFALPEVTRGIMPGVGGTQLLPRTISVGMAKQILFSGQRIDAAKALSVQLVNEVVPLAELLDRALSIAKTIAANAPISLKQIKRSINSGIHMDIDSALEVELEAYYQCVQSEDRMEGVLAFNEKRPPRWQGK